MSVGVLEAGFTVEPCPTMRRALDELEGTEKKVGCRTLDVQS
jgi:hypothetical protein